MSDELISRIHSFVLKEAYQDTNRETYQAMEGFIHQLNTLYQKENRMCLIDYGLDVSVEGKMVTSNLLQVSRAGVGDGSSFDSPQQIFRIQAGVNKNKGDCHYDLYQLAYEVHQQRGIPILKEV